MTQMESLNEDTVDPTSVLTPDMAEEAGGQAERILGQVGRIVLGQDDVLSQMLITLLCGGHALLEGVPGTAKTLAIRVLSLCLDVTFSRIQFTPDLMPTDVTGVNMLNELERAFEFHPGPVFADVLLADEINRAPAKTQSSLLEALQERQVTVDGTSHPLSPVFTVFATQNPIEYEGTYPLPEAQLDRFTMKIQIGYPDEDAEVAILDRYVEGFDASEPSTFAVEPLLTFDDLRRLRSWVRLVRVEPELRRYIVALVSRTRRDSNLLLGASPRAGVALFRAAQASSLIQGRDYVVPDDVKRLAVAVLRHRVQLTPDAQVDGMTTDSRVEAAVNSVPAPQ